MRARKGIGAEKERNSHRNFNFNKQTIMVKNSYSRLLFTSAIGLAVTANGQQAAQGYFEKYFADSLSFEMDL